MPTLIPLIAEVPPDVAAFLDRHAAALQLPSRSAAASKMLTDLAGLQNFYDRVAAIRSRFVPRGEADGSGI